MQTAKAERGLQQNAAKLIYIHLSRWHTSLQYTLSAEKLSSCTENDSEFRTEGALTLKAFADNDSSIRGTESNNLSDDRKVRPGRDN